jgi:hypothetical protein
MKNRAAKRWFLLFLTLASSCAEYNRGIKEKESAQDSANLSEKRLFFVQIYEKQLIQQILELSVIEGMLVAQRIVEPLINSSYDPRVQSMPEERQKCEDLNMTIPNADQEKVLNRYFLTTSSQDSMCIRKI